MRPDKRHGSVAGYNRIPCRDACCRNAYARYRKELNWDKENGRDRIVSTLPTRRRVQALARIGWSQANVARAAGLHPEHLPLMMRNETIRSDTAARIGLVYEELSMQLPPPGHSSTYARNFAAKRGWLPPLAWDNIDDPNEQPTNWEYRPPTRLEQFDELVERGAGLSEILRALEVGREALEKWAARNGRNVAYSALKAGECVQARQGKWAS